MSSTTTRRRLRLLRPPGWRRCRQRPGPVGPRRPPTLPRRDPSTLVAAIRALREKGNEIDLPTLRGLVKAMSS